jgi:hypothetical protein
MKITQITRSAIHIDCDEKSLTLMGEALQRVPGEPDFIIYSNTLQYWDPPFSNVRIDDETKRALLDEVTKILAERNIACRIE